MTDIIIISTLNHPHQIEQVEKCINSIYENIDFKILVIGSRYIHYKVKYPITQLTVEGEFNYNKFMNQAIKETSGEYVLLCNNDLIFTPNTIETLLNEMEHFGLKSASPKCPEMHLGLENRLYLGYKVRREIAGHCLCIKREVFDEIGYLDETYQFWASDDIYAEQLKERCIEHGLLTKSIVKHRGNRQPNSSLCVSTDEFERLTVKQLNQFHKKDKKQIHIITPFYRMENLPFYLNNFHLFDIIWHPIFQEPVAIKASWIKPSYVKFRSYDIQNPWQQPWEPTWEATWYKINFFLDSQEIEDQDYYCFMNDDDFYDQGFFEEIRKMNDEVIFVNMERGDHAVGTHPWNRHPTTTCVAEPNSIRRGNVGIEQYIIRGDIMKQLRFNSRFGDGHMGEYLKDNFKCAYRPDLVVLFNLLEKGRWDGVENQI